MVDRMYRIGRRFQGVVMNRIRARPAGARCGASLEADDDVYPMRIRVAIRKRVTAVSWGSYGAHEQPVAWSSVPIPRLSVVSLRGSRTVWPLDFTLADEGSRRQLEHRENAP